MDRASFCLSLRRLTRLPSFLLINILVCSTVALAQAPVSFPERLRTGTPVSVTGELTVLYADDFDNHRAELVHRIRDEQTGRSFWLRFEGGAPGGLRSGARITVRGRAHESEIYLAAADGTGVTMQGSGTTMQTAAVTGDQRTLVMVANFRDKTLDPLNAGADCSMNAIADRMFTDPLDQSVDDMYRDTSLGKVSFSGQVVGPYTLDFASTDVCDLGVWAQAADVQAAASGIDPTTYDRKVYVMPSNACPFAGVAELALKPSRAWIFTCDRVRVYGHELGHNLGMQHASTDTDEYGDFSDIMGMYGVLKPVNGPHKLQMGWLPDSQAPVVTQDGLHNVAPLALDPSVATAPQVLRVSRPGTGEYYYLSYRQGAGFELNASNYLGRVSVHRWSGGGANTYLLAVLADGETFVDPVNGFTVTQVSHGDAIATVQVRQGAGCGTAAPTLTVSPQNQDALPGAPRTYDVSLVNNDAAGCPASTFSVGRTVPTSWTGVLSATSLLLPPGGVGASTLTVTSPLGAPAGSYSLQARVSDAADVAHTASVSATYGVIAGDTVAPTAPATLVAKLAKGGKQVNLSWRAGADNVAVAGYRVWRNGIIVATTSGTSWVDGSLLSGSSYAYYVTAYDAAGNVSAASNTASLSLSGGGRNR